MTTSPLPATPATPSRAPTGQLRETAVRATGPGQAAAPPSQHPEHTPVLDIVIPVYNEENDLAACVHRLHAYLSAHVPYRVRITIADNASTDGTWQVAQQLADRLPDVVALRLADKGRGRALRRVWQSSDAAVLAYMDVDLSTDLAALLPLVAPLISGHSDLAIGSRLARGSRVVRGAKREFISRSYNLLLRASLAAGFSDAQCGFKAIRSDVARRLIPMVQDTGWFFDTEMLVLAERAGLRIHEVPVDWVDDPDSRVDILATALEDLRGIARLGRTLARGDLPLHTLLRQTRPAPMTEATVTTMANRSLDGAPAVSGALAARGIPAGLPWQLLSFAAIGVASTLAYGLLFLLLRHGFGAQAANSLALLITAIGNTAANRRLTFGVSGRSGAGRHQLQGLLVFAFGLVLTSGSLVALHTVSPAPSHGIELTVLVLANIVATGLRFLLMRVWIFRRHRHHSR